MEAKEEGEVLEATEEKEAETEEIERGFVTISHPVQKEEEKGKEAETDKMEKTEKKEKFVLKTFITFKKKKPNKTQ